MRYKRYQYAVHNGTGLMLGGTINFILPLSIEDATTCIVREAASTAIELELEFDPFNLRCAVKPLRATRSKKNAQT